MKIIILKSLTLKNFKKIKDVTIKLNIDVTNISANNRVGKTTLLDAYTWLISGKDSFDNADFNIKTLDTNNEPIHKLEHSVEGIFDVDGKEIRLAKFYYENWVKRRGLDLVELDGHKTDAKINDVPVGTMSEYNAFIRENICDEQTFKTLTNPKYFPTRPWKDQRSLIIKMAGNIDPQTIFAGNNLFLDTYEKIQSYGGKTEVFADTIKAKKRAVKESLEKIPIQIEEVKNLTPEAENWKEIEDIIIGIESQIESKTKELSFVLESDKAALDQLRNNQLRVYELKSKLTAIEEEQKKNVFAEYYKKLQSFNDYKSNITTRLREVAKHNERLKVIDSEKQALDKELSILRSDYRAIQLKVLDPNEDPSNQICPITGGVFCSQAIEAKRSDVISKFNSDKSKQLEDNQKKGVGKASELKELLQEESLIVSILDTWKNETVAEVKEPSKPEFVLEITEEISIINEEIKTLEAPTEDNLDITAKKSEIQDSINLLKNQLPGLRARLSKKDTIAKNNLRIKELKDNEVRLSQELTSYEREEQAFEQYTQAYLDYVNEKVSGLFSIVRFKMFNKQINGGLEETCEAMIDGVPYSDLNSEGKINAGIDIINAISNFHQISAPLWIDNAEQVNVFLPTKSQLTLLKVSLDEKLTIN